MGAAKKLNSIGSIKSSILYPKKNFGLLLEGLDTSPIDWCKRNSKILNDLLYEHRAILFRNCLISPSNFKDVVKSISPDLMDMVGTIGIRKKVEEGIYLATEVTPKDMALLQHHEREYMTNWPLKIFFMADILAKRGGETTTCSSKRFVDRIDKNVLKRFREYGVTYVRNYPFQDRSGAFLTPDLKVPTWSESFFTKDKSEIEKICRERRIDFAWTKGDCLRTGYTSQGTATHPHTGEEVWFNNCLNHSFFAEKNGRPVPSPMFERIMDRMPSEALNAIINAGVEAAPTATYYGNGSLIEHSVFEDLIHIYESELEEVAWQRGDMLLLDNMLASHGRRPFEGDRRLLVAIAEPHSCPFKAQE